MMKHAHRVRNLANEDVDLNMEQFLWELNAYNFRICMHVACVLLVKH